MAKHVSEPWHYHVDTVGRNPEIVITKKNGDIVADIGGGELTDRISNASLIAAAPALLAACEEAIDTLANAIRAGLDDDVSAEIVENAVRNHVTIRKLREAIAKATA